MNVISGYVRFEDPANGVAMLVPAESIEELQPHIVWAEVFAIILRVLFGIMLAVAMIQYTIEMIKEIMEGIGHESH